MGCIKFTEKEFLRMNMKKSIISSIVGVSLLFGVSTSVLAAENQSNQFEASKSYVPSTSVDELNSETKFGITDGSNPGEVSAQGSKKFTAATGRTHVDQEGLRFYGDATTIPSSFVAAVSVHGYLGKIKQGAKKPKWTDDKFKGKSLTRSAVAVHLGENKKLGGITSDKIICQAMHTVTTGFGTYSAESADTLRPIFI
ncbi:hypothetical protein predicted by Glimmer/Critica [Bacillus amyloliquefaciens DSM 7]|uniref:Uncharacterized protein n=3 Tax=Bacillus amyloliquefaciens TaxID=1390 RepID=A0A9P1NGZ4_BACAS|nr:hypothetical protein predicted by Glimmer/Critica [Bacillus amyloliquefaciens DSM 7] [Bacillus amyloliquefaciens DSM 7 = ATCC 23350]